MIPYARLVYPRLTGELGDPTAEALRWFLIPCRVGGASVSDLVAEVRAECIAASVEGSDLGLSSGPCQLCSTA